MGHFFQSRFYHERLSLFSTACKTIVRNLKGIKFEPEVAVLGQLVKPGDVCIDVGGAYGRYALPLSRLVGSLGRVYSFEPGLYSCNVFKSVSFFHGMRNVTLIKKALSDKPGEIELLSPIKSSGKIGASLSYIGQKGADNMFSETVPMTTIDIFCKEQNITKVDFIKCDTEGSELFVYKGAEGIIDRFKPTILSEVEDQNLARYGQTKQELKEFFVSKGYKVFALVDGAIKPQESMAENRNYFFIHPSKIRS